MLRLYLDTSVICAYFDDKTPERMAETRLFWGELSQNKVVVSMITTNELQQITDKRLLARMMELIIGLEVIEISDEMENLSNSYIENDVFTSNMEDDARHVATAVLSDCDILISWNFRHLVNRRRRMQINQINVMKNLPVIEILAPNEL